MLDPTATISHAFAQTADPTSTQSNHGTRAVPASSPAGDLKSVCTPNRLRSRFVSVESLRGYLDIAAVVHGVDETRIAAEYVRRTGIEPAQAASLLTFIDRADGSVSSFIAEEIVACSSCGRTDSLVTERERLCPKCRRLDSAAALCVRVASPHACFTASDFVREVPDAR